MAKLSFADLASQYLQRFLGNREDTEEVPITAGGSREEADGDRAKISTNLEGESHKAYSKMLEDKAAAEALMIRRKAEAEAAAKAAATQGSRDATATKPSAAPLTAQQQQYGADYRGGAWEVPNSMKIKTYESYYGNNPEALKFANYLGKDTNLGVGTNWGSAGNPYKFRNEYNTYVNAQIGKQHDFLKGTKQIMSYDQYWKNNPSALSYSSYKDKGVDYYRQNPGAATTSPIGNWGATGDPYRFRNEYNKYLASFPAEDVNRYTALSASGKLPSIWL